MVMPRAMSSFLMMSALPLPAISNGVLSAMANAAFRASREQSGPFNMTKFPEQRSHYLWLEGLRRFKKAVDTRDSAFRAKSFRKINEPGFVFGRLKHRAEVNETGKATCAYSWV